MAEQRDRERGRERHWQWIAASNQRGRALLLGAAYDHARSYGRLVRELDAIANSEAPEVDVALRPLDVDADATAVHALNEASFAANPDCRPKPFAGFCQEHLRAHDLDPGLSCVAEHGKAARGRLG